MVVPAGITQVNVSAWGGGGSGGGASPTATNGRSGGGGGGGAYATQSNIAVTPGNTLNVVVGAGGAASTGNGNPGGNSTITELSGSIFAAGGAGGTGNGGAGGAGGTVAASKGSTITAGGNGTNGGSVLLGLLLGSGTGGNGGTPNPGASGGAGGAGHPTVLLTTLAGNAGGELGGGGGGAVSASNPQNGGAGARGQVNVVFTCPTYSLANPTTALNACVTTGTSSVTLSSTAAGLPVGPYVVTYNTTNPTQNLTATITVTTPGTLNFTATGLTTPGTSIITVTNLTSAVCSSNISTNNSATITVSPATVGGAVSGGTTICSGATSAALSLTGNVGSVLRWESSVSPFSTWTPITNTTTSYTSGALTQTTQFRAVIQSGTCSAVNSSATTVTVNPLPQGSLTANGPFCATGAGQLTFTSTAGTGPFTIVYTENGGTNRTATGVVSGTAFTPFTTPVTATTTYALVSVTDANSCIRSTGFTGASAAITVNPLPQGSLSAVSPLCGSGAGQLIFTSTAGTGPFTVVYTENGGANRTATGVVSGTAFTPFTTPVTGTTTYTLVSVTGANSCVRNTGFTGASAAITVNPLPQGSLSAVSPLCGSGAGQLTFTSTAGTGPFTVVYTENGGTNRTATGVVSGTAFTPFTTPVTATTTYALVSVTDANSCIRSTGFTGASAVITVNPLPQGSLSAVSPLCGSGAGQLTFTSTAGTGPFTVVYTENGGTNRTATGVVSGTAFTPFTTPVTATTTYALVSVTDANSCIRSTGFTGASAAITVNPLPQGSLSAVSPLCGSGAGQLIFTSTAGTGPFTVVYTENGGANRTATGVVSGTAFTPFTTPVTGTTTYTLVSVTGANSCVRNTGFTGASAAITVNPLPQGSLSAVSPLCGSGAGQLTFTSTAGTGPFTVVYTENGGTNRTATGVVSGTAFTPFTTPVTATTTYALVSVTDANSCIRSTGFTGASAVITVNPLPQGSLSAVSPLCGSGAGQLTFTSTAGTGPFTVVYTENGGTNRTATGVVSGTAFTPFTTPVTATTTYALVSVTDANSCIRSTGFTGASAAITVNPLPQGSLSAVSPLCGSGAGQLTFTSTAGTGPFTVVYTENGGANRTATGVVSGTAFTPFTTPVTATTTYTLVSVTGANSCVRSSGFTANSAVITVNPIPAPSFTISPAASVCVETNVTYTTQSGQTNYIWTVPGTQGIDYDIISGDLSLTSNTVTVHWHTIGSKTVTVGYSSNGCTSAINASSTTTVVRTERGVVHGGTHICAGSSSPLLTLNDYVGTIVRWEYAEAIPYVWQPISHTADTYQPGILTTSTSYRAVIQNGTCAEEGSIETRIDVEPKPAAPVPGTVVQPTCVNSMGSITLNGLLTSGNWTITQNNGTLSQTYTGSGSSFTVTNLLPGIYTFTIYENSICPSLPTAGIEIAAPSTNIWNGTAWSKGSEPVITDAIRFSGDYSTTGNLSGCSCMIDSGVNVTVNSNHTLTITNAVTNDGGILTFENNSSLLQTANAINTGNIIYKRNTSTRRYDYTYWSSPIVRTPAYTLHDLSPNTLSDKYTSYNPNASWVISYGGVLEMIPGQGYSIRGPQNFDIVTPAIQEVSFIGVPNNGTISVPLVAAERFHLIGNPYPSAVYADQFIFDNAANLYGTLYFWTHNSPPAGDASGTYKYNSADYAIYNISGSTSVGNLSGQGAGSPGNQTAPLGYIAAGQSFFVKSKTTSSAIFTNAMRVPGSNSQFYKTNNSNKTNLERHRVWLNLTNTEGAFKQLLIGYIEGATNFWDQNYDAISFNGNPYVDFYSINEGQKLVIQGRALPFNESDVIPLGYRSAIQGEFTISIDHTDGVLSNQAIYLEDKVTNTIHNLQTSNYNFTTAIGTFPERFILKYTNTSLGVDDFDNQNNSFYVSVKDKTIKLNSTEDVMREVSIFDISGKLLYNNKKVENTEYQISNFQSGNQVLIVKVTLENGNIITKKIVFN
ncbi:T9SS sorting signal type C domain-containing protein [Flavobacterium johnsoniae]|uniref:T9SS sorting signal type C domain-containing protein n=1 Tax=Flavobacterium johnsoniae TaxID=986 RepID=UPI003D95FA7E